MSLLEWVASIIIVVLFVVVMIFLGTVANDLADKLLSRETRLIVGVFFWTVALTASVIIVRNMIKGRM